MKDRIASETLFGMVAIVVVALIAYGYSGSTGVDSDRVASLQSGELPPLQITQWFNAGDTTPTLEAYQGKVVVLEFWATWCPPCKAMIPHLKQLHAEHADEGLVIMSITWGDAVTATQLKKFIEMNELKHLVGLDTTSRTGDAYGVQAIPYSVIIGRDGKAAWAGFANDLGFDEAVLKALKAG